MEKKNAEIDLLIGSYLEGTLSDEDFIRLTEYLGEKPEYLAYFDRVKKEWISRSESSEKSWLRLKSKILRPQILDTKLGRKIQLPYRILRIAGVLIIGLLLGAMVSMVVFFNGSNKSNQISFNAPKGEKSILVLPDSSTVWLNGGSLLTTSRNFGITNRHVELTGEAYFEVTKNRRLPFVVTAGPMKVRVLGTKFNISAYADQEWIETTLKEGVIELCPTLKGVFKNFILKQDQMAVFDKTTSRIMVSEADVETKLAWKNNQLIIENENYLRVFRKLENWYGVKFNIENVPAIEPNYSMTIKTESLREILELMSIITPIHYKIDGENIKIKFKNT